MPEPIATVGIGVIAACVGKDALVRILGPTADYLGGELKEFMIRRVENLGRIFANAERKLGVKLNNPGQVSPKVLKTIVNEGSYSDDEIAVEYFGGVLASSRTEVGRDDRGARIAKMIDDLSAHQIRTNYLIYSTISELFSNHGNSFSMTENRNKMQLFMPIRGYLEAMEFTRQERDSTQMLGHIFHGFFADGLIEDGWLFGDKVVLNEFVRKGNVPGVGIVCTPSALGVELFLWAFGYGDKELNLFLTGGFLPEIEGIPKSIPNAVATKDTTDKTQ